MINVSGKKIFLSGPMSGIRNFNVAAFCDAHATLKQMGAAFVFNPALLYLSPPPELLAGEPTRKEYMLAALHELTRRDFETMRRPYYDMLVSIDGWKDSDGAYTERDVARACGIEVRELGEVVGDD